MLALLADRGAAWPLVFALDRIAWDAQMRLSEVMHFLPVYAMLLECQCQKLKPGTRFVLRDLALLACFYQRLNPGAHVADRERRPG